MKKYLFFTSLLITFLVLSCEPKEKHDIKLNLEVGQTYSIKQETSQYLEQNIMGTTHEMTHHFDVIYDLHIKDYEDNRYILEVAYNDLKMDVESPEMNISYGASNEYDPTDTLSMIFKAFIGKPLTVGINDIGEIKYIEGIEEFLDLIVADLDFIESEDDRQALGALDQFIGEGGFKDNLSQLTNYLPPEPVSIGQNWESEHIQTNLGFSGKWSNEWQLDEYNEDIAKITGASKFSIIEDEDADETIDEMPFSGAGIDIEMDGEQQMEHIIDKATGLIEEGTINANMDGYLKINEDESGMNLPISFEISSKITKIK